MKKTSNEKPPLVLKVFRSNKRIYAQVIDEEKKNTVASEHDLKYKTGQKITKTQRAKETGLKLAEKLLKLKIARLIFDRGHYRYKGRIKTLIEGVREGGVTI